MGKTIKELVASATAYATRQGFYDEGWNVPAKLDAIIGEVKEAHAAYAELRVRISVIGWVGWIYYHDRPGQEPVPDGFGIELADIVLRVCSLAGKLGIDLDEMIRIKQAHNESRPHLHGKSNPQ